MPATKAPPKYTLQDVGKELNYKNGTRAVIRQFKYLDTPANVKLHRVGQMYARPVITHSPLGPHKNPFPVRGPGSRYKKQLTTEQAQRAFNAYWNAKLRAAAGERQKGAVLAAKKRDLEYGVPKNLRSTNAYSKRTAGRLEFEGVDFGPKRYKPLTADRRAELMDYARLRAVRKNPLSAADKEALRSRLATAKSQRFAAWSPAKQKRVTNQRARLVKLRAAKALAKAQRKTARAKAGKAIKSGKRAEAAVALNAAAELDQVVADIEAQEKAEEQALKEAGITIEEATEGYTEGLADFPVLNKALSLRGQKRMRKRGQIGGFY